MLNIENILREKNMTQQQLAVVLGVSVQAVNSVIRGRSNPSDKLIECYARALKVPKEKLYDHYL